MKSIGLPGLASRSWYLTKRATSSEGLFNDDQLTRRYTEVYAIVIIRLVS